MFRKILKVKTTGSRDTGDLRPAFTDIPQGLNYQVYEYNEKEGWCIVEIYGFDHPVLEPHKKFTPAKQTKVLIDSAVIEELPTHPLSPKVLARLTAPVGSFEPDEKRKVVKREGKEYPYMKIEDTLDGHGFKIKQVVFDEG